MAEVKKYKVSIYGTIDTSVFVEAESPEEAEEKVDKSFLAGNICFVQSDFDEYDVQTIGPASDDPSEDYDIDE